jgi:hypothetical protein
MGNSVLYLLFVRIHINLIHSLLPSILFFWEGTFLSQMGQQSSLTIRKICAEYFYELINKAKKENYQERQD